MIQEQNIYDEKFVKSVFDRCSKKYIRMSLIMSFGFTERWRKQSVEALPNPDPGTIRAYDLMAGTGEVWPHLLKRFPNIDSITAVDISSGMHTLAMERLHKHRTHKIKFIEDNVFTSNMKNESADLVISTFGLKTFNSEQHEKLAKLTAKILKQGGVFSFIEASDPKGWFLRPLYLFHLKYFLPFIEKTLLKGAQDFSMIGTYSTNFGNALEFSKALQAEGLEVTYKRYFFGCATGVSGRKPADADL